MKKKVLLACEESQTCLTAFREKGIEAYSCDIKKCSGNFPEYHIQDDLLKVLKYNWSVIIAFPPCTDLTLVNPKKLFEKKLIEGKPQKALKFIQTIYDSCDTVCIENPLSSYLNKNWLPYSQIIQPYYFGHNYSKRTCLWLKNLPILISTLYGYERTPMTSNKPNQKAWANSPNATIRSKFHTGVAKAMSEQWIEYLK